MTPIQYAEKAQQRFLHLISLKKNREAVVWGKVVDALFAGNGDEAIRRCQEEGFETESLEIAKIFASGVDNGTGNR
jgi:hypothetical protein